MDNNVKELPRSALSYAEFWAFKYFAAAMSCINTDGTLERRMAMIPNGKRDYHCIQTLMGKLFENLCRTVDNKHLKQLSEEMRRTKLLVRTKGAAVADTDIDFVVVERETYLKLVKMLTDQYCMMCDKTGKESKRCKLRKLLDSTLPFAMPQGETCAYNDFNPDIEEETDNFMKARSVDEYDNP